MKTETEKPPASARLRSTETTALKKRNPSRTPPTLETFLAARPAGPYVLRLFVAGATARSRQAVLRVRHLCAAEPKGTCAMEVIDIHQQPRLARANQIVATPTLIKEFPRPSRRFIGNLANLTGLFGELDLITKARIVF